MADELLFADGFETYGFDNFGAVHERFQRNWDFHSGANWPSDEHSVSGVGSFRTGGSIAVSSLSGKVLVDGPEIEIVTGCWIYIPSAPTFPSRGIFVGSNTIMMAGLVINPDTSLMVHDRNTIDRGVSRPLISPGVFHHVETRWRFAIDESGEVEVRVDGNTGTPDIMATGIDMGDDPIAVVSVGQHAIANAGIAAFFDNFYIKRGPAFWGTVLFQEDAPDADGPTNDWDITGAATVHEALDETIFDGDTTCVTTDTVDEVASVTFPAMPADTTAIKAVYMYAVAKTSEPGDGELRIDLNGAEGDDITLLTDYRFFGKGHTLNPDGNAPWEESDETLLELVKTA